MAVFAVIVAIAKKVAIAVAQLAIVKKEKRAKKKKRRLLPKPAFCSKRAENRPFLA
jgi:hypothetical protein